MVKVIQDIWIQNIQGIVLFCRVFDEKVESQLFGALMSALNTFAEQISKDGLSQFELSKKRFTILKRYDLLFIGTCDKKSKEQKVMKELETIADRFAETYSNVLTPEWDGNISVFNEFEEKIGGSLEDPLKQFWKDF